MVSYIQFLAREFWYSGAGTTRLDMEILVSFNPFVNTLKLLGNRQRWGWEITGRLGKVM